jgi:FkbM family methyltransferase
VALGIPRFVLPCFFSDQRNRTPTNLVEKNFYMQYCMAYAMAMLYKLLRIWVKFILGKGITRTYSQDGEDVLAGVFLRKPHGTYVDVGGYHPIQYSNTYAFYRRGWNGVVIDANDSFAPLYRIFRPRDRFVSVGVGTKTEEREYYRFSDGAYNTFSTEDAEARKKQSYPTFKDSRKVAIRPLRDIISDAGLTHVDFLTIDIEGLEMEALASYDWHMPPSVIAVEDNDFSVERPHESPSYPFLVGKGYVLSAFAPRTLIFTLTKREVV